jgi:hypothetical protein
LDSRQHADPRTATICALFAGAEFSSIHGTVSRDKHPAKFA